MLRTLCSPFPTVFLLSIAPFCCLTLSNRALCYFKLEFYRKCIKDCDDALELDPKCAAAFLRKGQALLKMGKESDAKSVFETGMLKAEGDVEVMLSLRRAHRGEELADVSRSSSFSSSSVSSSSSPQSSGVSSSSKSSLSSASHVSATSADLAPKPSASSSFSSSSSSLSSSSSTQGEAPLVLDASLRSHQLDEKQAEAVAQLAARGMVQNGVGIVAVDQRIAFGNLQVNTGKYAMAVSVFGELLKDYPNTVAAYLGRGTALALSGALEDAGKDFSAALVLSPHSVDALKRRAQVYSALGREKEALTDLDAAVQVSKDADSYYQRGLSYYKLRNYRRGITDLQTSARLEHANKATYNYMGQCYICMGQPTLALENFRKALALDPSYKEALVNLGQAYKEWAKEREAFESFDLALKADPHYAHAFYLRGLAYFGIGLHKAAYNDFTHALQVDKTLFEAWWMRAVCASGIGLEVSSIADFDRAIAMRPEHAAWYQRQLALFYHHHMDTPFSSYNIDAALDAEFKEWWCKRIPPQSHLPKQPPISNKITDVDLTANGGAWIATPEMIQLVQFADSVGKWVHQDSPGFLENRRQIAMAGYAALEIAQALRQAWGIATQSSSSSTSTSAPSGSSSPSNSSSSTNASHTAKAKGPKSGKGAKKSSSTSSSPSGKDSTILDGKSSSADRKPHPFGWRDMYDIAVKWRQYSEPNDPVWWVDLLTPVQFAEGFGSHTPIVTGQCKVIRYGRMYERSLPIFKALMKQQCVLTPQQVADVDAADGPDELYKILNRDFFVVTPCHSTATPGKIMEGTRLTIQNAPPEGFEYSIRTPGTPPRWIDYDIELAHLFDQLAVEVKKKHSQPKSASSSSSSSSSERITELILSIAFYWYNFMPLARGTAICGYVSILGMFLAAGIHLQAPIPANVLLDWDAILLPTPKEFIDACSDWMIPHRKPLDVKAFEALPLVKEAVPTLRHLFSLLNTVCK